MDVVRYSSSFPAMLAMAEKIGISRLVVLDIPEKAARLYAKGSKVSILSAVTVSTPSLNKLGRPNAAIVVSVETSRQLIDHPYIDCIIGAEAMERKDRLHQRNSGLNESLAGTMASTGKVLLFDMSLLSKRGNEKVLGRFMQNATLAMKKRIPTLAVSGASSPYEMKGREELKNFLAFIGALPSSARAAEDVITKKISCSK